MAGCYLLTFLVGNPALLNTRIFIPALASASNASRHDQTKFFRFIAFTLGFDVPHPGLVLGSLG
jgi:hypothetical protein